MYRSAVNGNVSHVDYKVNDPIDFLRPCGMCINCRLRRSQDWAIRMVHEAKSHPTASFVTLTYDDAHLPKNNQLDYSHVQLFIKKLRKQLDQQRITFYRVGEYGGMTKRPHYHLLIFNYDFRDIRTYKSQPNHVTKTPTSGDHIYYKSTFADALWGHGFVDIGYVDYPTAQYVAKYVTKKQVTPDLDCLSVPETSSMSKKRPIGISWIEKYYSDVYPHDYVVLNQKKLQPPKFYDLWLQKNHPDLWTTVKQKREDAMSNNVDLHNLYNAHFIKLQKHRFYLRDGVAPTYTTDEMMLTRKCELLNAFTAKEKK